MNRNKSPSSQTPETPNGRKRRLKSPPAKETETDNLDKSKTSTANEEDDEDFEEQEESFRNRKSLRIKNKSSNQSVSPSSQSAVTPKKSKDMIVNSNKQKSTSSITSSNGSDRKLNGAQFVAAAAAGNFNVSASIGSTSITIDSNSNQDLTQLNHNVEILTKTLSQHSILLKQLNGSIEKLSNKLELNRSGKKQGSSKSKQSNKSSVKRQIIQSVDTELNDDESFEEQITLEESQGEDDKEDQDQEETINKSQQVSQTTSLDQISEAKSEASKADKLTEIIIKQKEEALTPIKQNDASEKILIVNETMTQTVKLTNIDQINEENPRQSNSFYYLSDSSKSDDDDDDDDENVDDDDNEENNNQEGKKNKRTSLGLKSPTKAILNKTKIDTEFISKLIANKDPNDKRYDPNEINKLRLLSHSYQNFAVKLLIRLFDEDEIIGRNVYGRNYSGDKSFMKQPLDPERINFIKETVLKLTKTNNPDLAWASCVIAMNRKMVDINNKFIKSHKNE